MKRQIHDIQRCKAYMVCRDALQYNHVVHTVRALPPFTMISTSLPLTLIDVSSLLESKPDLLFNYACTCLLLPANIMATILILTPARNYAPGFIGHIIAITKLSNAKFSISNFA